MLNSDNMINSRYIVYYFAGIISAFSFITIHRLINNQTNQLKYSHERRKKAVFFGDSITQHGSNTSTHGWVAKFTEWYAYCVISYFQIRKSDI